jgi:AraC family transcriptional regulator, exoenzyme S synthesis regulatory protein ExsA
MLEQKESTYAEILMSCVEEKFFKTEAVWDYHSFMRILSGEMKIVQADASYTFQAGDTLFVPRNQLSTVIKRPQAGQAYKSILITFRQERLQEHFAKRKTKVTAPASQKVRPLGKHPLLESYFASITPYFDLQEELPEELTILKLEEAISILRTIDPEIENLLADFSEPGKIDLPSFMENNFMFNMPLEKFAYLTGRSIATFNRDFRKAFHATPQKWLTQKRLEMAHYQLREKRLKPGDVYIEAGFENLSHFSFAFKKHFGYTPRELGADN